MAVSVTERWEVVKRDAGERARPAAEFHVVDENGLTVAECGSRPDDALLCAASPALGSLVLRAFEGLAEDVDRMGAELSDPESWAREARAVLRSLGLLAPCERCGGGGSLQSAAPDAAPASGSNWVGRMSCPDCDGERDRTAARPSVRAFAAARKAGGESFELVPAPAPAPARKAGAGLSLFCCDACREHAGASPVDWSDGKAERLLRVDVAACGFCDSDVRRRDWSELRLGLVRS